MRPSVWSASMISERPARRHQRCFYQLWLGYKKGENVLLWIKGVSTLKCWTHFFKKVKRKKKMSFVLISSMTLVWPSQNVKCPLHHAGFVWRLQKHSISAAVHLSGCPLVSACQRQQSREWLIASQGAWPREVLPRRIPARRSETLCTSVRTLRDLVAHHAAALLTQSGASGTHLTLWSANRFRGEAVNDVHTHLRFWDSFEANEPFVLPKHAYRYRSIQLGVMALTLLDSMSFNQFKSIRGIHHTNVTMSCCIYFAPSGPNYAFYLQSEDIVRHRRKFMLGDFSLWFTDLLVIHVSLRNTALPSMYKPNVLHLWAVA